MAGQPTSWSRSSTTATQQSPSRPGITRILEKLVASDVPLIAKPRPARTVNQLTLGTSRSAPSGGRLAPSNVRFLIADYDRLARLASHDQSLISRSPDQAVSILETDLQQLGVELYAFLRGEDDRPAAELLTEDFAGHLTDGLPLELGGDYRGRDDMIERGWGRVGQDFDMKPDVESLHVVQSDLLIGRGHYVGRAISTNQPVRAAFAHFWTVRDGRFSGVVQVTDSGAWTAALQQ